MIFFKKHFWFLFTHFVIFKLTKISTPRYILLYWLCPGQTNSLLKSTFWFPVVKSAGVLSWPSLNLCLNSTPGDEREREREGDRWLVRAVSRATDAPDQLSNARERARAFYVHARLGCSQDEAGENVWALVFGRRSPGKMSVMTPYRETRS